MSKDTYFLVIEDERPLLTLDAMIYDWNKIEAVDCHDKVSKVHAQRGNRRDSAKSSIAFRFVFFKDTPNQ